MELFISKLVSSIIQIILFAFIPFVWWFVTARKKQKFAEWTGLKKAEGGKNTALFIIIVSLAFLLTGAFTLYAVKDVQTAVSDFRGLGAIAVPSVIVYAVLNTSFPEELFFRGFLLKRISDKFGFTAANIIQSVVFGLIHGVMFFSYAGAVKTVLIIAFTALIGWSIGYINEKKANGSIIPGWIIHASANIFSGLCAAFSVF